MPRYIILYYIILYYIILWLIEFKLWDFILVDEVWKLFCPSWDLYWSFDNYFGLSWPFDFFFFKSILGIILAYFGIYIDIFWIKRKYLIQSWSKKYQKNDFKMLSSGVWVILASEEKNIGRFNYRES